MVYQNRLKQFNDKAPYEFIHDIDQHYSYLVAGVIKHDLSFNFKHKYWLIDTENGNKIQRVTMGMAYFYAPFFLVAHQIALHNDQYEASGYSLPYSVALHCGSIFYVLLGVYFLMLFLHEHFRPWICIFLGLVTLLGTNLFYYTYSVSEFSHSYLFTLNTLFIYCTIRWHKTYQKRTLFLLALLFRLMVLIRPTELLLMLFPLFYGVYNIKSFKSKLHLLYAHRVWLLISLLFFMLPILPQLWYWKTYGGSWIIYSYGNEKFFFNNPHLFDFLIGFRKGWLVYTPIMALSLIGLGLSFRKGKEFSWGITLFLVPMIYILSSWWCWWYGGSFGMRSMVEFYAFLALPFGTLLSNLKSWPKHVVIGIATILTAFNLFNTYQFHRVMIHWDANTRASYLQNFLKTEWKGHEDYELYQRNLIAPDYENASKGIKERIIQRKE